MDKANNRLAPYNPTHISAQGRALDLLQLTNNDILFDLGCGDGRLILAAIDRYYYSSSSAAAATANSSNDEYATNDNNGDEEDEDGSGDSNIDRPSIINRRQSTRSSDEKMTIVRNNTTTGGINNNDYLNNSLTTKVSNLTLSNSFGYNNWNINSQSQSQPSSSSILSSSFFIDATANKSTNATTTANDNNNSDKISNSNSNSNNSDDCGSLYNVYSSREGSKSFDNDKSESEYSFPHMMRMRSGDDDDDDDNGNEDAEYSFLPHLMRMKSGSHGDFDDDNYNHNSNDNDEITSSDIFDNSSDATTQLSSSPFGHHLGGVMMNDRVSSLSPSSGVSQLQPPPILSPNTPITPQTDNCKKKRKDHDVLYLQKINVFDDAVSSPMILCPAIPYDEEDDDDAHNVDDDDDDNHNNDNNDNNNHKMCNGKVGIPKTIKTTLPKNDNDDDIDDDDNANNVYSNEQQNTKKKQHHHHHHHRNYYTSSLTTRSAYPIQEQRFLSTPTEICNNYDSDNDNNYNNDEAKEEENFAFTTQTLETIPSGDELITNTNTNNNHNDEYENDDGTLQSPKLPCEKHVITSNKYDEQRRQSNSSNSSTSILQTRSWLRCVGIEINQALAKSAQENVQLLYMTSFPQQEQQQQSLMNSVCIHCCDVMEEINRSRHNNNNDNNNNNDSPHSGRNDNNDVEDSGTGNALHVSWHDGYGDNIRDHTVVNDEVSNTSPSTTSFTTTNDEINNWDCNVSELTLLDDATAIFVYLLPKGLEKIKPILHAAALIRHKQRESQISRQSQQKPSLSAQLFRQQQHYQLHPLHKSPQLRTLDEKEDISAMFLSYVPSYDDDGEMEFCPLPQQRHRKRGDSHVSDITDDTFCNFTRTSLEGMGLEVLKILHEDESNGATAVEPKLVSSTLSEQRLSNKKKMQMMKKTMIVEESEMIIPSFRVVSYMFQIPGWTPVTVDRSSKGQCPLYLYENIYEEDTS